MLVLADNRGSAGILSIIVMMVLGVLGATFITLSSSEVNTSARYRDGIAAQYLAEAGVQRAIVELANDSTWTGATNVPLGSGIQSGRYTVSVTGTGSTRTVASTGVVNNASRKVVINITLASGSTVFSYPLFSQGNMNIGNADVYGSTRSNGTINLNNGAHITIDVIAQGDINGRQNAKVDGQILDHQTASIVPSYSQSDYSAATSITSIGKNETLTLERDRYYSSGQLQVDGPKGQLVGNATIYVAGNVLIENGAEVSGQIFIIAEGDIIVKQGAKLEYAVLYSNHNIKFEENSEFKGAAIAKGEINIDNNAKITWDNQVVSYFGLGGGNGLIVNSWSNQ